MGGKRIVSRSWIFYAVLSLFMLVMQILFKLVPGRCTCTSTTRGSWFSQEPIKDHHSCTWGYFKIDFPWIIIIINTVIIRQKFTLVFIPSRIGINNAPMEYYRPLVVDGTSPSLNQVPDLAPFCCWKRSATFGAFLQVIVAILASCDETMLVLFSHFVQHQQQSVHGLEGIFVLEVNSDVKHCLIW